eukprot:s4641_g4.t1
MRHLRLIAGDFPQITELSHHAFLCHRSWPSPARLLLTRLEGTINRYASRALLLSSSDIVLRHDWSHLSSAAALLQQAMDADPTSRALPIALHPENHHICFFCPCSFATVRALKQHMNMVHQYTQRNFRAINIAHESVEGMPHCRICDLNFSTWQLFKRHMALHTEIVDTQASLQDLDQHLTAPSQPSAALQSHEPDIAQHPSSQAEHPPQAPEVALPNEGHSPLFAVARATELGRRALQLVTDQNWSAIKEDEAVKQWLCTHCVVCNVYVGSLKRMNSHMRQHHAAHIEGLFQLAGVVLKRCATLSPCEFCYKAFQHEHLCPATIQAAMILLHEMPSASSELTSDQAATDSASSRRTRRLIVHDFVLARDSMQGQPQCRHCRKMFNTLNGLRLHIALDKCTQFLLTSIGARLQLILMPCCSPT